MSKIHQPSVSAVRGLSSRMEKEVSIFHLIIWLFLTPQKLSEEEIKRIKGFYFSGKNETVGFDPIASNEKELEETIICINNQNKNCLIKVVISDKYINKVQALIAKYQRVISVYQFIQNPQLIHQQKPPQSKRKESEYPAKKDERKSCLNQKYVQSSTDMNYFLEKASREVEKFTKHFRTFFNSLPLINHFAQDANKYRLHLLSSINMKTSDLPQSLKEFQNFSRKQLPHMSKHVEKIENNKLLSNQYLGNYLQDAKQFITDEIQHANTILKTKKQEHKKENFDKNLLEKKLVELEKKFDTKRDAFYIKILDTYQGQRFYYQLLNATLKTVTESSKSIVYIKSQISKKKCKFQTKSTYDFQIEPKDYQQKRQSIENIKYVSLPFSQTYKAINFFYRQAVQRQMSKDFDASKKFYTKPFTVYRAGRIKRTQLKYYKQYQNEMFIQFYGFTSTSLDVKVALGFAQNCKNNKDSEQHNNEESEDVVCIFKINCHLNPNIVDYNFANHGFYRYTEQNVNKEFEKQVLFNSLNIFKLLNVRQEKIISLMPEKQKKQYQSRQRAYVQKDNQKTQRDKQKKYHQSEIHVIQLDYGSFHDVLLEQNPYNLQKWQIQAKENYVYYMNKALKYKFQQFDFADACQLLNQLERAYEYLKTKVNQNVLKCCQKQRQESEQFEISQVDDKNYCLRLSQICLKLGKSQQGLQYAKLSQKCQEVMSKYEMREIYNHHYEKFFQMQSTVVNILQQNSDFLSAQRELKRQIQMITSKKFTDPKAKLRQSEIKINLGVNQFEIGKLKECLQTFKQCSKKIEFALRQITVTQVDQPTWKDYFSNLCLPQTIYCFCNYFQAQKERRIEQKKDQLEKYYGGQQQLCETEGMVKDVSSIAKETLVYQMKFCKNQTQYQQLLKKLNANIQKESIFQKTTQTAQEKLENEAKSIIIKISSVEVNSKEYDQLYEELQKKVDIINKNQKEMIVCSKDKADISEFIEKFRERQRKRRLDHLKERKKLLVKENHEKFKKEYTKEVEQIKQVITKLKFEGYLDHTTNVLKQQNNIAKILFEGEEYQQALKQVQGIIKYDYLAYQKKHFQLASAYLTQAKIQYQLKKAQPCLQAIQKALEHLQKTFLQNRSLKDIEIKTDKISQLSQIMKEEQTNDQQKAVEILKQNNLFLEIKTLKAKGLLLQYEDLQKITNQPLLFVQRNDQKVEKIQVQIQDLLIEVNKALQKKDQIEDINDLKVQVLQVQALFILIKKVNLQEGFKLIKQCLQIRNKKLGYPNAANTLLCSEIILKYYADQQIRRLIEQYQIAKKLTQSHFHFEKLTFYKTIKQAVRIIEKVEDTSSQNNNNGEAIVEVDFGAQTTSIIQHNLVQPQSKEEVFDFDLNEHSQREQNEREQQTQTVGKQIQQLPGMSGMKKQSSFQTHYQSGMMDNSSNNLFSFIQKDGAKASSGASDLLSGKRKNQHKKKPYAASSTKIDQQLDGEMIEDMVAKIVNINHKDEGFQRNHQSNNIKSAIVKNNIQKPMDLKAKLKKQLSKVQTSKTLQIECFQIQEDMQQQK